GLRERLERLLGERREPLVRFEPPARFDEELELPDPVSEASALLFAAKRLLDLAEEDLLERERALVSATLTLDPVRTSFQWCTGAPGANGDATIPPVVILLRPGSPTRSARLLVRLVQHRLEALPLPAPIERVHLAFAHTR